MGLWNFVKNAGKSLGIGSAEAAEPEPEAEPNKGAAPGKTTTDKAAADASVAALKKEVEALGLAAKNLKIEVQGDKVRLTGKAVSQEEKEKAILAVGNVEGIATVEDDVETPEPAKDRVPHRRQGRQPVEDRREAPRQRRPLPRRSSRPTSPALRPRQDLPRPDAPHPRRPNAVGRGSPPPSPAAVGCVLARTTPNAAPRANGAVRPQRP